MKRLGKSGDSSPWKGRSHAGTARGVSAGVAEAAVRLVAESRGHHDSEWAAITSVAAKLGVGTAETVCKRVRQPESMLALVRA